MHFWKRGSFCCHYFVVQGTRFDFSGNDLFLPLPRDESPHTSMDSSLLINSSPICLSSQRESAGMPETFELMGRSLLCHCPSPALLSSQEGLQQTTWKRQRCFSHGHLYKTCMPVPGTVPSSGCCPSFSVYSTDVLHCSGSCVIRQGERGWRQPAGGQERAVPGGGRPSLMLNAVANMPKGKAPMPNDIWNPPSPNPKPWNPCREKSQRRNKIPTM